MWCVMLTRGSQPDLSRTLIFRSKLIPKPNFWYIHNLEEKFESRQLDTDSAEIMFIRTCISMDDIASPCPRNGASHRDAVVRKFAWSAAVSGCLMRQGYTITCPFPYQTFSIIMIWAMIWPGSWLMPKGRVRDSSQLKATAASAEAAPLHTLNET